MPDVIIRPGKAETVQTALSEIIDWGLKAFGIPPLWQSSRGEGVRVAVLDTGIAAEHPDLATGIEAFEDFTHSGLHDGQGHGTHVSGIIGARANHLGVVGVAPACRILMGKVLNDDGAGSNENIAEGIRWAISRKADIINMSLGGPAPSAVLEQAVMEALKAGVAIIAAAGNEGEIGLDTIGYPAKYPGVIVVGSVDRNLKRSKFSSIGQRLDVMAPGGQILSTYPPRAYAVLSGTSMATPFVSGVAALCLAKHRLHGGKTPCDTPAQLREHLLATAKDRGVPGQDPLYGAGLIQPGAVLES